MIVHKPRPQSSLLAQVSEYAVKHLTLRARRYCKDRGITNESMEQWHLGYFPQKMAPLFEQVSPLLLREAGLIYSVQYSPLQRRLTLPIYDQYGNIVAISGRPPITEEQRQQLDFEPKYWHNSFDKGRILYGLHLAKDVIRELQFVIVTEGQFDVIVGHQCGIRNLVCSCGTALTEKHLSLLARYTSEIIIVFDGDSAGYKMLKKISGFRLSGVTVRPCPLPIGYDLDSFLRAFGKENFFQEVLPSQSDFEDSIKNRLKTKQN